jgi:transposase
MNRSKKVVRMGMDVGKKMFHVFGVDDAGSAAVKKKLRRKQVLAYFADLPPCLVAMEACGGSHYWAREIGKLGHEVKLISPQFVKPYVKGNKNDYNDAEGICEAAVRPGMRFVTVKSVAQQDLQGLHRIRQSVVKQRTALVNQIRGLLGEYGIVIGNGMGQVRRRIPEILEDGENGLTDRFRGWLAELLEAFRALEERIKKYDREIEQEYAANEACQRLGAIEGIGPKIATAVVATYGDGKQFRNGRQFAAGMGLVPRQHTTGDKPVLLGISKRGDTYLRTLLIHGARSVIKRIEGKEDRRSRWLQALVARRGKNKAAVALANKNARIVWALLTRGECYGSAG